MATKQQLDLSAIGLNQKALEDRIVNGAVDKIVSSLLEDVYTDDDGEPVAQQSAFDRKLRERVDSEIARIIDGIAAATITPKIEALIEGLSFQKTNGYGEPKAPPQTWREMLVEKAEGWLVEPVNSTGKTRKEDSYSFSPAMTRIAFMINQHLDYRIRDAMTAALKDANGKIAKGIVDSVQLALNGVLAKFKVEIKL